MMCSQCQKLFCYQCGKSTCDSICVHGQNQSRGKYRLTEDLMSGDNDIQIQS